jgi:hypothetical protein
MFFSNRDGNFQLKLDLVEGPDQNPVVFFFFFSFLTDIIWILKYHRILSRPLVEMEKPMIATRSSQIRTVDNQGDSDLVGRSNPIS